MIGLRLGAWTVALLLTLGGCASNKTPNHAPVEDRGDKGKGFTHKLGDIVTVSSAELGSLTNRMTHSDKAAPWTWGPSHLMRNLASRGLL